MPHFHGLLKLFSLCGKFIVSVNKATQWEGRRGNKRKKKEEKDATYQTIITKQKKSYDNVKKWMYLNITDWKSENIKML